jgi:hypothetical protein
MDFARTKSVHGASAARLEAASVRFSAAIEALGVDDS